MDDSSLDHYTFTEEEQTHATHICQQMTRRQISKRRPTYIDLTVGLDSHRAAVQITITPSLHPLLPRQTIISLHCRYGLCCRSISGEVARERIRQTVRGVVGAYFQLFEWDFSDEDCYTRDLATSPRVPNHSCSSAAQAILSDYIAEATGEPNASVERRPAPNAEAKRRRLNTTESRRDLSNEDIAERLTRKTVKGLLQCRRQPRPNYQLNILDTFRSLDIGSSNSYAHYATKLVEVADKLEHQAQTQRTGSWYTRFLASCVTIASTSLPALPAETFSDGSPKDRFQIARQESVARITNMIVSGLWNDWGEKAFLMYRAFAELNYKFHIIQSLGVDRLSIVAQNTVEKLKKVEVPSFSSKEDLFDPSWMLCQFLNSDNYQGVCNALKLPHLRNTDNHSLPSSYNWSTVLVGRANSSPLQLSLPGHTTNEHVGSRSQDKEASGPEPIPSRETGDLNGHYDISTSAQHQHRPELNSQAHTSIPDNMSSLTQHCYSREVDSPQTGMHVNAFTSVQHQHCPDPDPRVQANISQMDPVIPSPTQYYDGGPPFSGEQLDVFDDVQHQHYPDPNPRVQANIPQMDSVIPSSTQYYDGGPPFSGEQLDVFDDVQHQHYPDPNPRVQANIPQMDSVIPSPTHYYDGGPPFSGEQLDVFDDVQHQHCLELGPQVQASIPRIDHDISSSIQQCDDQRMNPQSSEIQASNSESTLLLRTSNLQWNGSPDTRNRLRKRPSQSRLSIDRITKKSFTGIFLNPNASNCLAARPPRTTYASAEGVVRAEMQGDKEAGGPEEHRTANGGGGTFMDEVDEAANGQNDTSMTEADEDEAGEHERKYDRKAIGVVSVEGSIAIADIRLTIKTAIGVLVRKYISPDMMLSMIPSEYLSFLRRVEEMKGHKHFDIKTSKKYTKHKLRMELEAKEFPAEDIIGVRMLDLEVLWRITIQQLSAKLFQEICPWVIIQGGTGGEGERFAEEGTTEEEVFPEEKPVEEKPSGEKPTGEEPPAGEESAEEELTEEEHGREVEKLANKLEKLDAGGGRF
ncbi:MAG: hypothetical protein M1840_006729 [Geoglossum simile]|nr:MAG: hypothetical protein M1840_006729 [Geoglossum simile]